MGVDTYNGMRSERIREWCLFGLYPGGKINGLVILNEDSLLDIGEKTKIGALGVFWR